MKLYLQTHEFVEGLTNAYGAKVIVHERNTKVVPSDEGVFVAAGSETNIALRRVRVSQKRYVLFFNF